MNVVMSCGWVFLDRMDLFERRRMVADSAINAYKTVVLCTLMADYDLVPGVAPERLADDLSRALEEAQWNLLELNAAHQESVKELIENVEKSLGDHNQKLEEAERKAKEANAAQGKIRESLSSSKRKVTYLSADRARLTKSLAEEASKISGLKADVSAWEVHFEEAKLKISGLEKELESQVEVSKLVFADI